MSETTENIVYYTQAGLRIERLEEFPVEQGWRFGHDLDELHHLPGKFLLVACKDG